ncbi:hypothetical protein BY996DRAFT_6436622 [Phakopsora pachyrhizi]|uniref:Uncharacterized protein n=1 Tax=Phakopsora pachyrhizi TaxID=170000 RepID=A0AAV0B288_PHAPC|nr:hypothetical protein BY996DRAFT_6436622 [Phakopsora pachyrhizi]CAH7677509.1 hypothetical protein PPACK8108_LOCUS12674 [Phakopsora pachyrhizi]
MGRAWLAGLFGQRQAGLLSQRWDRWGRLIGQGRKPGEADRPGREGLRGMAGFFVCSINQGGLGAERKELLAISTLTGYN